MKRYFVRNVSETLASLAGRDKQLKNQRIQWEFNLDQNKIIMYDYIQMTQDHVPLHCGLAFDCHVYSPSSDEAIRIARGYVELLLAIVSYAAQVGCVPPNTLLVYDASEEEMPRREFSRRFYPINPAIGNLRPIKESLFRAVFERVGNQDERIIRAMMWLRKSLMEEKDIDKFIACWVGLDALSKLLVEKLLGKRSKRYPMCPACGKAITTCPHCGSDVAKESPSYTEGIAELFRMKLGIETKTFKREWWPNRNKVLHGDGSLSPEFMTVLVEQLPVLRKALIIGIGLLVELPETLVAKITKLEPRVGVTHFGSQLMGWINDLTPPSLRNPQLQPWVELAGEKISTEVTERGKITISTKAKYHFRNANFSVHSHGIIGGKLSGLKADDYTLNSVKKEGHQDRVN